MFGSFGFLVVNGLFFVQGRYVVATQWHSLFTMHERIVMMVYVKMTNFLDIIQHLSLIKNFNKKYVFPDDRKTFHYPKHHILSF
jgi:hypothetical protein